MDRHFVKTAKGYLAVTIIAAIASAVVCDPAYALPTGPFPAGSQTVVSFASSDSAANAAKKADSFLDTVGKQGWSAINVSSADMFRFVLSEQAISSGGVQGATEWDVYLLLVCRPPKGKAICPAPVFPSAAFPSAPNP